MFSQEPLVKPTLSAFTLVLLTSLASPPLGAQPAAVPRSVAVWYGDLIGLYQTLFADLDAAEDAKAIVLAFQKALKREASMKLVARFRTLAKLHPDFFRTDGDAESTWTPTVDWNRIQETYSLALGRFGNVMKKVFSYQRGHPEVTEALNEFGRTIGPILAE